MRLPSLKQLKVPHVFVVLSLIVICSALLTFLIPSGSYQREEVRIEGVTRNLILPGTYQPIPKHFSLKGLLIGDHVEGKANPTSLLGLISAIPKGLNQSAALVFYVFIIGGVFSIVKRTGTLDALVYTVYHVFRNSRILLVSILFIGFALSASFLGIGAELMPLIPLLILIAEELGYNRLFGVSLLVIPFNIGWAAALTNPFNLQIAHLVAEVPIGSGMGFRSIFFMVVLIISLLFLLLYGKRVWQRPSGRVMNEKQSKMSVEWQNSLRPRHLWIILSALLLLSITFYAVNKMGWGIIEMSGAFLTVGVISALIGRLGEAESMNAFIRGLEMMVVPALVVGFARGINVVLDEALIMDTILHEAADLLQKYPEVLAAEGMYVFQSILNFFIPSASGQALITMPLMAPLADLTGVSRLMAIFTFTCGDGFSNIIIPTNGILMAMLSIGGVSYEKWFKYIISLFLVLSLLAGLFILLGIYMGY